MFSGAFTQTVCLRKALNALLAMVCVYCVWQASWIPLKAHIAQWLISAAWEQTLQHPGATVRPWPWADTQPVARLTLPNQQAFIVLAGAQGNSLAFGPGLVEGSDPLGSGFSVVGGHRDTHFSSLGSVQLGQMLRVQTVDGQWLNYRVTGAGVIDVLQQPLISDQREKLILVTCYPLEGLNSDPSKRWVVTGERYRF